MIYSRVFSALAALLFLPGCGGAGTFASFAVKDGERQAIICRPKGNGPFPAVVYNHGSIVDANGVDGAAERGNDLTGICAAFAKEGYLAFLPIREPYPMGRKWMNYRDSYKGIVARAVDHVKTRPDVDSSRVALVGFSMGGLSSLMAAPARGDLRAIALLAPASGRGRFREGVARAGEIQAPVLLMIESHDEFRVIRHGVKKLENALREAGKEVRLIRYNRGGGHQLFWSVDYYWKDLADFLKEKFR
jgi:dienelactone hydrolase